MQLLATLVLLGLCAGAFTQTHIDGEEITVDTMWTPADGPYYIDGQLIIVNASVTILPGIEIIFSEDGLFDASRGILIAGGSPQMPVIFRSATPSQNPAAGQGQLLLGEASFDNVAFNNLQSIVGVPSADTFTGFTSAIFTYNGVASSNFYDASYDSCTFIGNDLGIVDSEKVSVSDSVFKSQRVCVSAKGLTLSVVSFGNCTTAVQSESDDEMTLTAQSVFIFGSDVGFVLNDGAQASISSSNIMSTRLLVKGHMEGLMTNNFWDTADVNAIVNAIELDDNSPPAVKLIDPIATAPFPISILKKRSA